MKLAIRELVGDRHQRLERCAGAKSPLTLRARIGERGRISFNGPIATRPLSLAGNARYVGARVGRRRSLTSSRTVNVVLTDGALATKGQLTVDVPDNAPVRASWKGTVTVSELRCARQADLLRSRCAGSRSWSKTWTCRREPFRAATGRIGLEDFYARVIVYPDATLNLARLVTPGASPEPAAGAKPATANRCGRCDRRVAAVDRSHRRCARQREFLGSVRQAELFGQSDRRRRHRVGAIRRTARRRRDHCARRPRRTGRGAGTHRSVRDGALARPCRQGTRHRPASADALRGEVRRLRHREGQAHVRRPLPGRRVASFPPRIAWSSISSRSATGSRVPPQPSCRCCSPFRCSRMRAG